MNFDKKKKVTILVILIILILGFFLIAHKKFFIVNKSLNKMEMASSRFVPNGIIPQKYTCDGDDVNPYLRITEIPNNTKSLVLIVDDPDAIRAVGKLWVHWVVFDIPVKGNEVEILENEKPKGVEGKNDFGNIGYGGPCPPAGSGVHHYNFKIYALDTNLLLGEGATKKEVEDAMENHIVDKVKLVGTYSKE